MMDGKIGKFGDWEIRKYGLFNTARQYYINSDQLLDHGPGDREDILDWPIHLIEKGDGYDYENFLLAYRAAIQYHHPKAWDAVLFNASVERARAYWKQLSRGRV